MNSPVSKYTLSDMPKCSTFKCSALKSGFTIIELIIAIAVIGIIAVGISVETPRELLNVEKNDRLGNYILGELRTIGVEATSGKLSPITTGGPSNSVVPDRTELIIGSGSIMKNFYSVDSDGRKTRIHTQTGMIAPFFGESGYRIASIQGKNASGGTLLNSAFSGNGMSDEIIIGVSNKTKQMDITYSGASAIATNCGSPCKLFTLDFFANFGNHSNSISFDSRTGVSSISPELPKGSSEGEYLSEQLRAENLLVTKESVFSAKKALVIANSPGQSYQLRDVLESNGLTVTIAQPDVSFSSIRAMNPAPDIIVCDRHAWNCGDAPTSALFNALYDNGYHLITFGNDTEARIRPITEVSSVTTIPAGTVIPNAPWHYIGKGWTSIANSGTDSRRLISWIHPNAISIAKDSLNGTTEAVYLEEPSKGRWLHVQTLGGLTGSFFDRGVIWVTR